MSSLDDYVTFTLSHLELSPDKFKEIISDFFQKNKHIIRIGILESYLIDNEKFLSQLNPYDDLAYVPGGKLSGDVYNLIKYDSVYGKICKYPQLRERSEEISKSIGHTPGIYKIDISQFCEAEKKKILHIIYDDWKHIVFEKQIIEINYSSNTIYITVNNYPENVRTFQPGLICTYNAN
jgi:hypothetical protein